MSFEEILEITFLNNSVKQYAIFTGIMVVVLIINKFLSRSLLSLAFKGVSKIVGQSYFGSFKDLLTKPLKYLIVICTLAMAFNVLNFPKIEAHPDLLNPELFGTEFKFVLLQIFKVIIVLIATWIVFRIVDFVIVIFKDKASQTETQADDQLVLFSKDILKVLVIFFAAFAILGGIFHLNITSLVTTAGIAGIAIAFAAKDSIENLLGSFTIFIEQPFTVGDFIQIGDVTGTVEKVGFRSTRIRTLDKTFVTLPNRKIIDSTLDNLTLRTLRRVRFFVGVEYGTTSTQIQAIVNDIQNYLNENNMTTEDGLSGFYEFGPSSMDILVQYYIHRLAWADFVKIKEEINFEIMKIVEKHGADFAFPTQTIHLKKEA